MNDFVGEDEWIDIVGRWSFGLNVKNSSQIEWLSGYVNKYIKVNKWNNYCEDNILLIQSI